MHKNQNGGHHWRMPKKYRKNERHYHLEPHIFIKVSQKMYVCHCIDMPDVAVSYAFRFHSVLLDIFSNNQRLFMSDVLHFYQTCVYVEYKSKHMLPFMLV